MKSLFNIRSIVFAFAVIVFAGCSGITETTLPDDANITTSSTTTEVLHQEVTDRIDSVENEAPTIMPTTDRYIDRE